MYYGKIIKGKHLFADICFITPVKVVHDQNVVSFACFQGFFPYLPVLVRKFQMGTFESLWFHECVNAQNRSWNKVGWDMESYFYLAQIIL